MQVGADPTADLSLSIGSIAGMAWTAAGEAGDRIEALEAQVAALIARLGPSPDTAQEDA